MLNPTNYRSYVPEKQPQLKTGASINNPKIPNTPLWDEEKQLQTFDDNKDMYLIALSKVETENALGNLLMLIDSVKDDFEFYQVDVVNKLWGFTLSIMERMMYSNPVILEDSTDNTVKFYNVVATDGTVTHHLAFPGFTVSGTQPAGGTSGTVPTISGTPPVPSPPTSTTTSSGTHEICNLPIEVYHFTGSTALQIPANIDSHPDITDAVHQVIAYLWSTFNTSPVDFSKVQSFTLEAEGEDTVSISILGFGVGVSDAISISVGSDNYSISADFSASISTPAGSGSLNTWSKSTLHEIGSSTSPVGSQTITANVKLIASGDYKLYVSCFTTTQKQNQDYAFLYSNWVSVGVAGVIPKFGNEKGDGSFLLQKVAGGVDTVDGIPAPSMSCTLNSGLGLQHIANGNVMPVGCKGLHVECDTKGNPGAPFNCTTVIGDSSGTAIVYSPDVFSNNTGNYTHYSTDIMFSSPLTSTLDYTLLLYGGGIGRVDNLSGYFIL